MDKNQKQPAKTCADCIHETACRVWTDGRAISDASASQCPSHETVKESAAYLCGVLDERKRKQINADRIRSMSDEELAKFFGDKCVCPLPTTKYTNVCGDCDVCWLKWLQHPAEPPKEE